MEGNDKLEWSFLEYEEKERGNDWFWALGIAVFAGAIAAFIYENYFFGLLIIISGALIALFAIKKPEIIPYSLDEKGLTIKNQLFKYKDIKNFWINNTGGNTTLYFRATKMLVPMISVPIDYHLSENIRKILLNSNVKEEEIKPHLSEKIMDSLGF